MNVIELKMFENNYEDCRLVLKTNPEQFLEATILAMQNLKRFNKREFSSQKFFNRNKRIL